MRIQAALFLGTAPTAAVASGGEVLTLLSLEALMLVAVFIAALAWRSPFRRKILALTGLTLGLVLAWLITWNIPHSPYVTLVAALHIGLPLLGTAGAIWLTRD